LFFSNKILHSQKSGATKFHWQLCVDSGTSSFALKSATINTNKTLIVSGAGGNDVINRIVTSIASETQLTGGYHMLQGGKSLVNSRRHTSVGKHLHVL